MAYPTAERQAIHDELHGRRVADPYRWLEDEDSPAARRWLREQDALLSGARAGWASRPALLGALRRLTPGSVSLPSARGERVFFSRREPGQEHAVYWVRDGEEERPLVDPAALDPALTTVLDGAAPSFEGDRLAYLTSSGGREESTLHVIDVADGTPVAEPVALGRGGDLAWLPGGSELFVVRRRPDAPRGEEQFHRRVWRHRVGADPADDELLFGEGRDRGTYYGVTVSPDGRWLAVTASVGTAPRNDLHLYDLTDHRWHVVQDGVDAESWPLFSGDGALWLFTNRDAPRWRLCRTEPGDPSAVWHDVLPEGPDVLTGAAVTDGAVVAVRMKDVVSTVTVHNKTDGSLLSTVELPRLGVARVATRPEGGDDVWIAYTDHTTPARVLHYSVAADRVRPWAEPPGSVNVRVSSRQVFTTSPDGTRVPMFVVAPPGGDGPRPTILYGYGGFGVSLTPDYSAVVAAWVEAGGVWAEANLRGGGEYGEAWHRAGMRDHKQAVYEDFEACADWLVAEGVSSPSSLGIFGGSNGGLLVGAALTRRPGVYRAVVCSAPLLDMVRYERFGLGETWNDEYGTASDPEQLGWLLSYSPYHHVTDGTAYPAVMFTVFDGDTRVDPMHARKMCAALQAATSADETSFPVLLRRESGVGHGVRALSRNLELQADELAFMAHHLGLGT
ncbi:MAG TPA: prolyl oligopeptidase family serine peptidase [Acidimicrobiales bacterium]|nr:prolyl oligopeptidase family serine peptidase [Acidimicrobiales bacterium]